MLRRLFTIAAVLLLLVGAALAALWVRSYRAADSVWWNGANRVHAAVLSNGKLELYFQQINATAPFSVMANRGHLFGQPPSQTHLNGRQPLGFGFTSAHDAASSVQVALIPYWFLVAIAIALAGACFWAKRRLRLRLHRLSRCIRCGYDLRATPNRCPECGHIPENATA